MNRQAIKVIQMLIVLCSPAVLLALLWLGSLIGERFGG